MTPIRPPLWLAALLVALTACVAPPTAPARPAPTEPAATGLDRVRELQAQGEFVEARTLLQVILREEPGRPDAVALLGRFEAATGIAGQPWGLATQERLLMVEVLGHIASGRTLLERGKRAEARTHVERALSEIEKYGLRARFPKTLFWELEEMRRQTGP